MTKEELVGGVKNAVSLGRDGKVDEMYAAYKALFDVAGFIANRPEDQRQALKLMVHFKQAPRKATPGMIAAHTAAIPALTDLVSRYEEPADYEMLGICHLMLEHTEAASNMFRAGLKIERDRSPQSDLCGTLMRRISEI
jgi:hypothetical protein